MAREELAIRINRETWQTLEELGFASDVEKSHSFIPVFSLLTALRRHLDAGRWLGYGPGDADEFEEFHVVASDRMREGRLISRRVSSEYLQEILELQSRYEFSSIDELFDAGVRAYKICRDAWDQGHEVEAVGEGDDPGAIIKPPAP